MAYTYEQLRHLSIGELREIAKDLDHEAVTGYTQLNKEHLLPGLCKALGIDMHAHHEAVGIDKPAIKARMRALKEERDAALAAHDYAKLKITRRALHHLNHQIRAHER